MYKVYINGEYFGSGGRAFVKSVIDCIELGSISDDKSKPVSVEIVYE